MAHDLLPRLDAVVRRAIVERLAAAVREIYVLADAAERMAALIEQNLHQQAYADITDASRLAERLTQDLLLTCKRIGGISRRTACLTKRIL